MKNSIIFQGREFIKSSLSGKNHKCVGVSIGQHDVAVINTNTKEDLVTFTHEEWSAFIDGVKNNEFNI